MNRCVTIEKQWTTGTHPSKYYINKAQKNTYHIQSSLPESGRITRSTFYYITVRWYQLPSCFPILPAWLYYHSSSCAVFIMLTKHWSSKESAECFCTSSTELLQMTCVDSDEVKNISHYRIWCILLFRLDLQTRPTAVLDLYSIMSICLSGVSQAYLED